MTNIEAFKFLLDEPGITDTQITEMLGFYDIDPSAVWDKSAPNCDFYRLLIEKKIKSLGLGVRSESEGGYSITYDNGSEWAKALISGWAYDSKCSSLIGLYGGTGKPAITDISALLDR